MFLMIDHHCINSDVLNKTGVFYDKTRNFDLVSINEDLVRRCSGAESLAGKVIFVTTNVNSVRLSDRLVAVDEFITLPRHIINYIYHLCICQYVYRELTWIDGALIEVINYILQRRTQIGIVDQNSLIVAIVKAIEQQKDAISRLRDGTLRLSNNEFTVNEHGCFITDYTKPLTNSSLISYLIDTYELDDLSLYIDNDNSRLALIKSWNDLIILGGDMLCYDGPRRLQLIQSRVNNICLKFLNDRRMFKEYVE